MSAPPRRSTIEAVAVYPCHGTTKSTHRHSRWAIPLKHVAISSSVLPLLAKAGVATNATRTHNAGSNADTTRCAQRKYQVMDHRVLFWYGDHGNRGRVAPQPFASVRIFLSPDLCVLLAQLLGTRILGKVRSCQHLESGVMQFGALRTAVALQD